MFIASKLHDRESLTMSEVVQISKKLYTKKDIQQREMKILLALDWRLLAPTAHEISHHLLRLVGEGECGDGDAVDPRNNPVTRTKDLLSFLGVALDLAMFDEYFLRFRAPTVALASTIAAFRACERCPNVPRGATYKLRDLFQKTSLAEDDPYLAKVQQCETRMWGMLLKVIPRLQTPNPQFTPISPAAATPVKTGGKKRDATSPDSVHELYRIDSSFVV